MIVPCIDGLNVSLLKISFFIMSHTIYDQGLCNYVTLFFNGCGHCDIWCQFENVYKIVVFFIVDLLVDIYTRGIRYETIIRLDPNRCEAILYLAGDPARQCSGDSSRSPESFRLGHTWLSTETSERAHYG